MCFDPDPETQATDFQGRRIGVDISDALPGADMIRRGLADLAAGRTSDASLLVLIGAPRLRGLGVIVPDADSTDPELQLYARLASENPNAAHSRYNALVRLLVSFERALQSDV